MTHKHEFKITMKEILKDGIFKTTKEYKCGKVVIDNNKSGMWRTA